MLLVFKPSRILGHIYAFPSYVLAVQRNDPTYDLYSKQLHPNSCQAAVAVIEEDPAVLGSQVIKEAATKVNLTLSH